MIRYLTIAGDGAAEIEVKRSRFLCTLQRVEDEAAARAVVDRLRKERLRALVAELTGERRWQCRPGSAGSIVSLGACSG